MWLRSQKRFMYYRKYNNFIQLTFRQLAVNSLCHLFYLKVWKLRKMFNGTAIQAPTAAGGCRLAAGGLASWRPATAPPTGICYLAAACPQRHCSRHSRVMPLYLILNENFLDRFYTYLSCLLILSKHGHSTFLLSSSSVQLIINYI